VSADSPLASVAHDCTPVVARAVSDPLATAAAPVESLPALTCAALGALSAEG